MPARPQAIGLAGIGFLLVLGLTPWWSVAAPTESGGRKFAFLVGIVKYNHAKLRNLEFAEADVEELAGVLRTQGFQDVLVLTGAKGAKNADLKPTARNILTQLVGFLSKAKIGKDDLIVVGLAGHGIQPLGSDESYFCPCDANPTMIAGKEGKPPAPAEPATLVPLTRILKLLDDGGAGEKLLLVDACRNDPEVRGGRRGVDHVSVAVLPPQTGVLLSCSTGEFSFENKSWGKGHGAFFYQVIEGLNGEAGDLDGTVTFESLAIHVRKSVPRAVRRIYGADGGEQRPNLISNLSGEPRALAVAQFPRRRSTADRMPEPLVAPFDKLEAETNRNAWAKALKIEGQRHIKGLDLHLVLIPAGQFMMGSSETPEELLHIFPYAKREWLLGERPQHRVMISRPFYIGQYEITKAQFQKFVQENGYKTEAEKDGQGGWGYTGNKQAPFEQRPGFTWRDWGVQQSEDAPVVNVSFRDAIAFCEWLSRKEGKKFRLPTEAEWEYACRAGTTGRFYHGDDPEALTKFANVADARASEKFGDASAVASSDGWPFTAPVGRFTPNNFGLFDMLGNALEWCQDIWEEGYYASSPEVDPPGSVFGSARVLRGGGWCRFGAAGCRCATRYDAEPNFRSQYVGFRLVCDP